MFIEPLTILVNCCIADCAFPSIWKENRVTPIPKEHGTADPTKFRPISIAPIFSKLAESWLLHCLKPYLSTSCWQFAFKRGSSVEDAIATVQTRVAEGFNSCPGTTCVALISLDISKDFDQVSHRLLLKSLQKRLVPGSLLSLLKSYLNGRTQSVVAEGAASARTYVPSGVPQGSVIAPSLFTAFVDPLLTDKLPSTAHPISQLLFADDFLGIKILRDQNDERELQLELDEIVRITNQLGLSVNVAKSAILLCSLAPRPLALSRTITANGTEIPVVDELKYLGVALDRKLAFTKNAQITATKAKCIVGVLWSQVEKFAGVEAFRVLCTAKLLPVLSYCLPVIAPKSEKDIALLESVNRFALRLLLNDFSSSY